MTPEEQEKLLKIHNRTCEQSRALYTALYELLNLAEVQLDQSATHDGLTNCDAIARARAAIAKATA